LRELWKPYARGGESFHTGGRDSRHSRATSAEAKARIDWRLVLVTLGLIAPFVFFWVLSKITGASGEEMGYAVGFTAGTALRKGLEWAIVHPWVVWVPIVGLGVVLALLNGRRGRRRP
jgi:hypothetical protein